MSCHRLKDAARGLPVVMVPLVLYSDDTGGNRPKNGINLMRGP